MISSKRHTETDHKTGKNLYIIEAYLRDPNSLKISDVPNKEFEGTRYKVRFHRGVGRTTNRLKAQWFSEQLEYVVTLHKDEEPWLEVKSGEKVAVDIPDEDSAYTVDADNDDYEDFE